MQSNNEILKAGRRPLQNFQLLESQGSEIKTREKLKLVKYLFIHLLAFSGMECSHLKLPIKIKVSL